MKSLDLYRLWNRDVHFVNLENLNLDKSSNLEESSRKSKSSTSVVEHRSNSGSMNYVASAWSFIYFVGIDG